MIVVIKALASFIIFWLVIVKVKVFYDRGSIASCIFLDEGKVPASAIKKGKHAADVASCMTRT